MGFKKRFLFFGWGMVAVLAGALGYRHFHRALREGRGPAGPAVSRERFAKTWSDRPVLFLGFGDSVTAGYGSTPGHSYFERLLENPPDEWSDLKGVCLRSVLPKLTASNHAVNGTTSFQHLEKIRALPKSDADVRAIVVMTTGGNDLVHDYGRTPPREGAMFGASWSQAQPWVTSFENRVDEMMRLLQEKFPGGCEVFLGNIFDPTDEVGDIANAGLPAWPDGLRLLTAYNEVIERVATQHEHVHLVDTRGVLLGHGIHCSDSSAKHYTADDPHYWYYANLEDPNDRGYDALRRAFLLQIAAVLAPK